MQIVVFAHFNIELVKLTPGDYLFWITSQRIVIFWMEKVNQLINKYLKKFHKENKNNLSDLMLNQIVECCQEYENIFS